MAETTESLTPESVARSNSPHVAQSPARRYAITPLLSAMGETLATAAPKLGIGGPEYRKYRDEGMNRDTAERKANKAGFHVYEIWPEMVDHDLEATVAAEEARRAKRREQLTNAQRRYRESHPEVREYDRQRRRAYYAEAGEYERKRERERYARNREQILAKKREQRRLRRLQGQEAEALHRRQQVRQDTPEAA